MDYYWTRMLLLASEADSTAFSSLEDGVNEDAVATEQVEATSNDLSTLDGESNAAITEALTAPADDVPYGGVWLLSTWQIIAAAVLCLLLGALAARLFAKHGKKCRSEEQSGEESEADQPCGAEPRGDEIAHTVQVEPVQLSTGRFHQIGTRNSQQDSIGLVPVKGGLLAAVADGMGGLADGDKVSQQIIQTIMNTCASHDATQLLECLDQVLDRVNEDVNNMLGAEGLFRCGSTLVAVLATPECFRWISVGDSRLYLLRAGGLIQMNREHIYETELSEMAVNRDISFQEAHINAKKNALTSFIGMGKLKYIDLPLVPVTAIRGDKLMLASDGVFKTLPEHEITSLLGGSDNPEEVASAIETAILERNLLRQDNFSAILVFYS